MRNFALPLVLVGCAMALGSCGKPASPTIADDRRIDQAMARVQAEQDRTDRAESDKQSRRAARQAADEQRRARHGAGPDTVAPAEGAQGKPE